MMNNLERIFKLEQLGKLPSEQSQEIDDFPLDEFDQLLQSIDLPITLEIAKRLIRLSPPSESGCFGMEWAILSLIESLDIKQLQALIHHADKNEVVDLITMRLENYYKNE